MNTQRIRNETNKFIKKSIDIEKPNFNKLKKYLSIPTKLIIFHKRIIKHHIHL